MCFEIVICLLEMRSDKITLLIITDLTAIYVEVIKAANKHLSSYPNAIVLKITY